MKKNAMSEREIETLKLLKVSLPEFEIYPNMRLADVIKADRKLFNQICKYHLDFVICDHQAHVIAAVELDDYTHDNNQARERDAKKDEFLRSADIRLFRICLPNEAIQVAKLIRDGGLAESVFVRRKNAPFLSKPTQRMPIDVHNFLLLMGVSAIGMLVFWVGFNSFSQNLQKQTFDRIVVAQQVAVEQQIKREKEALKSGERRILPDSAQNNMVQQAMGGVTLVKAKSARECRNSDGAMDNKTVLCMKDHYVMLKSDEIQAPPLTAQVNAQKIAAWNSFYKEPQFCNTPRLGAETQECLNRNIMARNAFEAEWKAKHGNQ